MSTIFDKIESTVPGFDLSGCKNCSLVKKIVEDSLSRRNGKPTGKLSVYLERDDRRWINGSQVEFSVWSTIGDWSSRIGQYRSKIESEDRPNCLECRGSTPIGNAFIEISGNYILDLSLREFTVKR